MLASDAHALWGPLGHALWHAVPCAVLDEHGRVMAANDSFSCLTHSKKESNWQLPTWLKDSAGNKANQVWQQALDGRPQNITTQLPGDGKAPEVVFALVPLDKQPRQVFVFASVLAGHKTTSIMPDLPEELTQDDVELTPREEEVLGCLCCGFSNREISGKLEMAEGTVKVHIKTILKKTVYKIARKWRCMPWHGTWAQMLTPKAYESVKKTASWLFFMT